MLTGVESNSMMFNQTGIFQDSVLSETVGNQTMYYEANLNESAFSTALHNDSVHDESVSSASVLNDSVLLPANFSYYLCHTSYPIPMGENYPHPQLRAAATHLDAYELMQVVAMGAVMVVSVVSNVLVMVVVALNSFLRSTVNYYLVNLALADLLITCFCWPTVVNRLTTPLYLLGRPLCRLSILTQGTCVTVSVLSLAVVACDRVYAVLLPLRARRASPGPTRPLALAACIWFLSLALTLPAFYVRDTVEIQWNDYMEETCTDRLLSCHLDLARYFTMYKILMLLCMFFVPGLVMALAYTIIIFRLWCVRRGISDPTTTSTTTTTTTAAAHTRTRHKVVKMTAMVLLTFFVCWSPLHAIILYDLLEDNPLPEWLERAQFWAYLLGYSNSAINPLLYGGCSDNFRLGLRNVLFGTLRHTSDRMQSPGLGTTSTIFSRITRQASTSFSRKSSSTATRANISHHSSNSLPTHFPRREDIARKISETFSRKSSTASTIVSTSTGMSIYSVRQSREGVYEVGGDEGGGEGGKRMSYRTNYGIKEGSVTRRWSHKGVVESLFSGAVHSGPPEVEEEEALGRGRSDSTEGGSNKRKISSSSSSDYKLDSNSRLRLKDVIEVEEVGNQMTPKNNKTQEELIDRSSVSNNHSPKSPIIINHLKTKSQANSQAHPTDEPTSACIKVDGTETPHPSTHGRALEGQGSNWSDESGEEDNELRPLTGTDGTE